MIRIKLFALFIAFALLALVRPRKCLELLEAADAGAGRNAAAKDVLTERSRQVKAEGWTPKHDDQYTEQQMPRAAATYVLACLPPYKDQTPDSYAWPWDRSWWKPSTPRRNLVKAAALLLAEIERLDRAQQHQECPLPPAGWRCTRRAGHDGPCAAVVK